MDDRDRTLSTDVALSLLSDDRRRRLVRHLAGATEGLTVGQVRRRMTADDAVSAESLEVALRHAHLPKLERAGVVGYDSATRTVSQGPQFEAIFGLLRAIDRHQQTRKRLSQ